MNHANGDCIKGEQVEHRICLQRLKSGKRREEDESWHTNEDLALLPRQQVMCRVCP